MVEADKYKNTHFNSGQSDLPSTLQASLEIILNVPYLDIFIKTTSAKYNLQLKELGKLK